jgi:hypothetical protein
MDEGAGPEEPSIESELAATIRYIDLYLRQKTDLFLQHYLFEPFDQLKEQVMILSVIVTLLAAGTLFLVVGVILLVARFVALWEAFLIVGALVFLLAGGIATRIFSNRPVLKTPTADEVRGRGRT